MIAPKPKRLKFILCLQLQNAGVNAAGTLDFASKQVGTKTSAKQNQPHRVGDGW
jgi:hypothetical protein